MDGLQTQLKIAIGSGDIAAVESLIGDHPALLDDVGKWWGNGLHTRFVSVEMARLLADRGAPVSVHAAAGLGLMDHLARLLAADPKLINAKGCDACTPLHFARNVEIASVLLDHGARIDARDEDHESTPAQWLIGQAPEVAHFLLTRGAQPDIFLAAALGDRALAEKLIAANPACLTQRIGRAPNFPPIGHQSHGGTIYQWSLAFNSYPHQIALLKGHGELFNYLYARSDTATRLLVSCVLAHREEAEAIVAQHPDLVPSLAPADLELVARYCWETNTNYDSVKLMLDIGFPVAHPERSHGYTPLHNAAWAGSADLVELLIARGHPLDIRDPRFKSTPLGYALHDCLVEKRHPEGEFARVVGALIDAGCAWEATIYPTGNTGVDEVLRVRLKRPADSGPKTSGADASTDTPES
ncbi:MAG: ankyrin repeat domain-containing protein [Acidobacteriota bacterium]